MRNSSSSSFVSTSSSSWWRESEVTLSFKIYFPSISFSTHTLMLICGGMSSTGACSKVNTTGIFALWENTLGSSVSSNRHLTVEKKFFKFEVYLMQKPRGGSGVCVTSPSLSRVRTFVFKHDVRVRSESEGGQALMRLMRSGLQDSQKTLTFRALSNRGQRCNNIFPRDFSPFPSWSSHL